MSDEVTVAPQESEAAVVADAGPVDETGEALSADETFPGEQGVPAGAFDRPTVCAGCGSTFEQHQVIAGKCQECNSSVEAGLFLSPGAKNDPAAIVAAVNKLASIVFKQSAQS